MAPSERTIWIDGGLVPWGEATVHILSHAPQRGALVFDYMSVHDTDRGPVIFRMIPHLERFVTSCVGIGIRFSGRVC